MDSEKQVFSVWGLPTEEVRERVKKVMKTLAAEFNGPEFEPHVTIVRAIKLTQEDAINKFNSACTDLKKAYVVHSKGVSTGTCVYLLLDTNPQVVAPSDHCCRHFGYERRSPYMPHMGLLYADLTEDEKKKAQERANAVDDSIGNLSFLIKRLALYKTDPEDKSLKSWEKIAEYELE
ncbi:cyclic phosphodiesterase-like [Silene latifolia]|uniref:cyclic phosphodiesterase-like n=1 Tax=Silene latifolia TaxID=37657 RepID=UPI003D7822C4